MSRVTRTAMTIGFCIATLLGACDDDASEEDATVSLCRDVGTTICREACACGDCSIDSGGVTISFDNEEDCRNLYVELGCMNPDATIDLDACSAELANPECADDPMGDASALVLPDTCASES